MIKLILAIPSLLCVASASAAAVTDPPSILKLGNDSINMEIQNNTKNVTKTDLIEEFRIFPGLPYANSCTYPGTCPSLHDPEKCKTCQVGYVKDPEDDTICQYENDDEDAFLLMPSLNIIELNSIDGKNSTTIREDGVFAYSRGADYSFRTNKLFWYTYGDRTIYTAPLLNYGDSGKESVLQDNSSSIRGIAVDWIYNHIYWFDVAKPELVVSNFNGTMKKVLFNSGLSFYVTTLVVNPLSGWMYWTDIDRNCIVRAGLDGSQQEVVLSTQESYPRGLVLDLVENRMYWSQKGPNGQFDSIWSSNLDGSDRKNLFTAEHEFNPRGIKKIALFAPFIYWIESSSVYKINKCDGEDLKNIYNSKTTIWDIKVYHSTIQPEGKNLCSTRINQCSHFCLPAPSPDSDYSVSTTTCACPDGLYLSSDERTCVTDLEIQMLVKLITY